MATEFMFKKNISPLKPTVTVVLLTDGKTRVMELTVSDAERFVGILEERLAEYQEKGYQEGIEVYGTILTEVRKGIHEATHILDN